MGKEQFTYSETQPLFKKLEELSRRSRVSRGQAFEDWLTAMVCALAAESKEAEYLAMIDRHKAGKSGKRGADLMAQMFAELIDVMSRNDADILGDLFQGSITYGEAGQYFSPQSIARLVAELSVDPEARPTPDHPILVNDCACGTGRMLLEASNINPHAEVVGQDIDARCAKITAINLGLRGRYGWVICGNSLSGEAQFAYRIGSFFNETPAGLRRGVIRDVPPDQTPIPVISPCTGRRARELFAEVDEPRAAAPAITSTIIEVPRWLARLEPTLATSKDEALTTEAAPQIPPNVEGSSGQKQKRLF